MSETILLVEDDVSIRKALQLNLQLEGYDLLMAEDGETGRRLSQTEELDLIVVDLGQRPGSRQSDGAVAGCRRLHDQAVRTG